MQAPRVHHHQRNSFSETYGTMLEPGDRIAHGDVYDCTDGTWRLCHAYVCGTPILAGAEITVIRPMPVLILGQVVTA